MSIEATVQNSEFIYDLFISYSNDPDYQLSRKVEGFLESFHKLKTPKDIKLKTLSVCRDGSDFSLHSIKKQAAESSKSNDFVKDVLIQYLQQSQYLLVLCSKNAALSDYVQFEIDWFIQNKGIDYTLLAVTEGYNIKEEQTKIFSERIIEHKLHTKILGKKAIMKWHSINLLLQKFAIPAKQSLIV